jgi:hypothetical protein
MLMPVLDCSSAAEGRFIAAEGRFIAAEGRFIAK